MNSTVGKRLNTTKKHRNYYKRINRKILRDSIVARLKLTNALRYIDREGRIMIPKTYTIPTWVNCHSCKYVTEIIERNESTKSKFCPIKQKTGSLEYSFEEDAHHLFAGWICLGHEIQEEINQKNNLDK